MLAGSLDFAVVVSGAFIASYVHVEDDSLNRPGPWLIVCVVLLTLAAFSMFGVYEPWRGRPLSALIARTGAGWLVAQLCALALLPVLPDAGLVEWPQFAYWAGLSGVAFIVIRVFACAVLAHVRLAGFDLCKVAIVGDGAYATDVIAGLASASESGFRAVALYHPEGDALTTREAVPTFGDLDAFAAAVRAERVTELWFAMPMSDACVIQAVLREFGSEIAHVRVVPDEHGLGSISGAATRLIDMPTINLAVPLV
ncbi:hypothetical protein [Burkholderia guangdongensis]|uniref:hypothetical protein n=1 Tax=Burkholderia guangdongensis TaxID=1792500 RepID=UPI0015C8EBE3|nr:hypothetical protein [Burkholderia guangdongensis]